MTSRETAKRCTHFLYETILTPERKRMQSGNVISSFFTQTREGEEKFSLAEADWRAMRDTVVRDSLQPVAFGLSMLYFFLAISHALLLPKPIAAPMSSVALGTGVALTGLHAVLRRWQMPAPWAHPVSAMCAGLVLFNCLLHLYFVPEPQQTTNLLLLIVGIGFFFFSTRWLTLLTLTALAGWSLLVWISPFSPNWLHFGFALYTATILSVMVHTVRVRTLKHLEMLRQQDERRKAELETALRATEEAHRVAEAMKQDLMQSEARLRLVTNQIPAVLWTTDSELHLTSSLGMGLTALDLQPHEVLEMMRFKDSSTAAPKFLPVVAHRRALEGDSVSYEINWKGHTFGCQVEPLHDANKKLIGAIGIAFDITTRKRAEETLGKSEEELRLTFDLAPVGMALTALDGKILQVNQAFCETFGYSAAELLSRTFADITHPDDRDGYLAARAQLLHGEIAHFQIERRFVAKSGKIICTLLQVGVAKDAQGAPLYFIGQAVDITELKRADEEIRQPTESPKAKKKLN
jgi:PAS domain S-box-containing protein